LLVSPSQRLHLVDTIRLPTNIDHAVVGLIDPAHVTFVHQSWFWRTAKTAKRKEKHFEPVGLGFRMVRHAPSANTKGYSILKGGTSTEITFLLPGSRFEHIQVGESDSVVSITLLTPINDTSTELNHLFYSSLNVTKYLWWPLKSLGKTFLRQDSDVFEKISLGLQNNPKMMLLGDPDAQARWYFELKKKWQQALEEGTEFLNPLKPRTLQWIT